MNIHSSAAPPGRPRFGLIGTGAWASMVHAPAAASCGEIVFASILGRRAEAARPLAERHGAQAFQDIGAFLETVDIVAIAVPPQEQPSLALAAARAGKHVLLEKPVAIDPAAARAVSSALGSRGLASVVFFPQLILPQTRRWIGDAVRDGGWFAAGLERFSQALSDGASPFRDSSWRHEGGALWDTAPHAVALLMAVFGAFSVVSAVSGRGDLISLTLVTEDGAVATLTLTRDAAAPVPGRTVLHGPDGTKTLPPGGNWNTDALEASRIALGALAAAATEPSVALPCDAAFGAGVTDVLAAAAASLEQRRIVRIDPPPA